MDLNEARNLVGQINLAANEGARGERSGRDACSLIVKLTEELAKCLYDPSTQPQAAPAEGSDQQQG